MFDFLMIDPSWILNFRTDALTSFFLGISKYVNYYSYMFIIAVGYWISLRNKPFVHLGFLFPFAVLLNTTLKGILQIPRPDESLRLVKTFGVNGFPSGDAQLSSVFWLILFVSWKNSRLRYLCLLPIVLISFSRVYLGVHSIYDVMGGIALGALIVYLFLRPAVQSVVSGWYKTSQASYWIVTGFTIALYVLVYGGRAFDPFFFSFIGLLLGYGLALNWIKERNDTFWPKYTIETYMNLTIAGIVLYSMVMYTNVSNISTVPVVNYLSIVLKYALVSFSIFALVPMFMKTLKSEK
jgi:hypothetical protein